MSKFRLASDKNLTTITKKYFGKVPVNEREFSILEGKSIIELFHPRLEGKHKITYIAPMSSISLVEYMQRGMTVHKLYNILVQIIEITKKIEIYGLYLNNLVLDKRWIYVRESTGKLIFLYEPVESRENSTNVYAFLADFIKGIRAENQEVQDECEKLNAFLRNPDNYRIEDFERLIQKGSPSIYQQVTRVETRKQEVRYDMEETTVLRASEDEDATVVLGAIKPRASLTRLKTSDKVEIVGNEFCIGKNKNSDYCIGDNNAISRNHAVILCRGNEYVIRDENSTNHTYVNGVVVNAGMEVDLNHGDSIRLADEDFEFYLE